ncbi:hypothetical protein HNO88_003356 [Novosphingobium chloroacetimidivorans]|uniref:Uncharacterized protein n=1 Tax=Novosphingobium chloroacetimidivorans TaxID=1428314 RepID=A0A7W7NWW8_9SPHN|nr:hypothetical protein [Novosphingobium chloroacetimidivorans]MBB4860018.1 hypothetical protein [Novosphingobium chloroacetimidivorans]
MVDMFALSVAHGLLVLAGIRLFLRDDLDAEGSAKRAFGWRRKGVSKQDSGSDAEPRS